MTGPVPVREGDVPVLSRLHATSFPPAECWSATVIALQLAAPGGFGFLDARGGMILARVIAGESEILTLAVDPSARRLGIGRGLLCRAMDWAREHGAEAMFLEVSVANAAAIGLYQAAGFARAGLRRRYYADGTDAWVMRVSLGEAAGG